MNWGAMTWALVAVAGIGCIAGCGGSDGASSGIPAQEEYSDSGVPRPQVPADASQTVFTSPIMVEYCVQGPTSQGMGTIYMSVAGPPKGGGACSSLPKLTQHEFDSLDLTRHCVKDVRISDGLTIVYSDGEPSNIGTAQEICA